MEKYEALATEAAIAPPEELKKCPVDNTFRIIGKKFTVLILRNNSIEDINPDTLSARLREMEKSKLVHRKVLPETPVRVEYTLTEKGKDLVPILE